jgi:hypothetical protein
MNIAQKPLNHQSIGLLNRQRNRVRKFNGNLHLLNNPGNLLPETTLFIQVTPGCPWAFQQGCGEHLDGVFRVSFTRILWA